MVDDMVNAGANVIPGEVVVDQNLVTCSYYGSVGPFMRAVFDAVQTRARRVVGAPA